MEEKERKERNKDNYVTKLEWVEDKSQIYSYINKLTQENRTIIEIVDDESKTRDSEIIRIQDRQGFELTRFNDNIVDLNVNIKDLTNAVTSQESEIGRVSGDLDSTKKSMITKPEIEEAMKLEQEKKKSEIYKLLSIFIPALIGAGGLLSWLGPIISALIK